MHLRSTLPTITGAGLVTAAIACLSILTTSPSRAGSSLTWQDCEPEEGRHGLQCATLLRPLNRDDPKGATVALSLVKRPASGPASRRVGTLFFNPGGPGEPGSGSLNSVYQLPEKIHNIFDVVTWDPRGTGRTTPLIKDCDVGMPDRPLTGPVDWHDVLDQRIAALTAVNRSCLARHGALITNIGTVDVAHDLEAMREAVGEEALNFWGVSYGTVIGSTYAALFPDRVRVLILDGNVDPWFGLAELSKSARAASDALRVFFQQNPDLERPFERSLELLNQRTIQLPDGYIYSRWDLIDQFTLFAPLTLFANTFNRTLIETVDAALFSRGPERDSALNRLQSPYLRSGSVDHNAGRGFDAILCQDFPQRLSRSDQHQLLDDIIRQSALIEGSIAVNYLAACSGYESVTTKPIPRAPFSGTDQIQGVVAQATWDGVTPMILGSAMVQAFPSMGLLLYNGNQHGIVVNAQSDCVENVVADALINGRSPTSDIICPSVKPRLTIPFPN